MKILSILEPLSKAMSGKKTYIAAVLAAIYWIGADDERHLWKRQAEIDAAAAVAVITALRAGSKTDRAKAVKAIKGAVVEAQQTPTTPIP